MAIKDTAQGLANLGRYGDSTLVHMQPGEVAGLQALANANGTSLTINPETGLPEAFSLGGFFKSFLPTLAGIGVGAAGGPLMAGIAAGALTGAVTNKKDPLMGAVMGGMGGYGGYGLQGNLANMGVSDAASNIAANPEGFANAQMGNAGVPGALSEGANIVGVDPAVMAKGLQGGVNVQDPVFLDAVKSAQGNPAPAFAQNLKTTGQNFADIATMKPGAFDAFKAAGGSGMQLGMPLAGAALGGLEATDLYGKPLTPENDPNNQYDPYATLNLNTNTGLKLYANGGPVSFADGGDTGKDPVGLPGGGLGSLAGGGAGAQQGAGLVSLDVADIDEKYQIGQRNPVAVPVPQLGVFADADQINTARNAYETQLKQAMSRQGGMGSPFGGVMGIGGMNRGYTGMSGMNSNPQGPSSTIDLLSANNTAKTADTALTARNFNVNQGYANGGTIQTGGLQALYGSNDDTPTTPMLSQNGYGLGRLQKMAAGGQAYAKGGYLDGAGDGMSDSIPATIEGKQPARLADGEFVIPADVVSHLGNGSSKAGSKRLYAMLDNVRKERTGSTKQGKQINPNKHLPA